MSRKSNRNYHAARAEDELKRAEEAVDPAVAAAHRELAALHKRQMLKVVDDPEDDSFIIPRVSARRAV